MGILMDSREEKKRPLHNVRTSVYQHNPRAVHPINPHGQQQSGSDSLWKP